MTGAGFLDTDPLYTSDIDQERPLTEQRAVCDRFVYYYLSQLSTYSQVLPISACTGAHALYERQTERYGTGNPGLTYVNLRPIRVPGGSTIPARCAGRLLSGDGGDQVVVCWQHQHSGWKVILEILTGLRESAAHGTLALAAITRDVSVWRAQRGTGQNTAHRGCGHRNRCRQRRSNDHGRT